MVDEQRQEAGKYAINAVEVVKTLYEHTYQIVEKSSNQLQEELKIKKSQSHINPMTGNMPSTWIRQFYGIGMFKGKVSHDDIKKNPKIPILFLMISLQGRKGQEPIIRYGVIEEINITGEWKGIKLDNYLQEILNTFHHEQQPKIKANHCYASIKWKEKPLLDIRNEEDLNTLTQEIIKNYGDLFRKGE